MNGESYKNIWENRVYRLGAFEQEQLVGVMMLSVAPVPLSFP
jgi:peptidoglycan pentaglycine glycine transferase (the first glycine)